MDFEGIAYGARPQMCLASQIISSNHYSLGFITKLCAQGMTVEEISRDLNCNPRSIRYYMKKYNIFPRKMDTISDIDLDERMAYIMKNYPGMGHTLLQSLYVAAYPLPVPRQRLRDSVNRVRKLRNEAPRRAIKRRKYSVKAPLSVVHIDGWHKLNRYRWVVHGGIDGYTRMMFFLKASNNNRALTVLIHFREGVKKYGMPVKIRTDHGTENVGVADYMLAARDCEHGTAVITGRSVHNQRIERVWRDLYQSTMAPFYDTFHYMENQGILNPSSDLDIFCLHTVASTLVTNTTDGFRDGWNCHKLRTMGNRSPNALFFKGLMKLKKTPGYHAELNQNEEDIASAEQDVEIMQDIVNDVPDDFVDIPPFVSPLTEEEEQVLLHSFDPLNVSLNNLIEQYILVRDWVLQCTHNH